MQIRWKELDPVVAAKIEARLPLLSNPSVARPAEATSPLEPIWSAISLGVAAFIVALYACVFFHPVASAFLASVTLGPLGIAGFVGLATTIAPVSGRNAARRRVSRQGNPMSASAALPLVWEEAGLSRAERLYAEVVVALTEEASREGRFLLRECNALLLSYARLETQRRRLSALWSEGAASVHIQIEREKLEQRWERETDALARAALEESRELCAERGHNTTALCPVLSRLEAQQEVICQTLQLTQTALARRRAAVSILMLPETGRLRDWARRVARETQAEEAAVAELTRQ